jgi:hypothetical protein
LQFVREGVVVRRPDEVEPKGLNEAGPDLF